MTTQLRAISGKISAIERSYVRAHRKGPGISTLAHTLAPFFRAIQRHGGNAIMRAWQSRYVADMGAKLARAENAAETNAHGADHTYWLDIGIAGVRYRGPMSGVCFTEGDEVSAIVDEQNRLLAIARADQTALVMFAGCKCGFPFLMEGLLWALKVFLLIAALPLLAINCVVFLFNNAYSFGDFFAVSLAIPSLLVAGVGAVFSLTNRREFVPAWLATNIFAALERPDLASAAFERAERDAAHDGRKRPGDRGRIFYFWPLNRTFVTERLAAL